MVSRRGLFAVAGLCLLLVVAGCASSGLGGGGGDAGDGGPPDAGDGAGGAPESTPAADTPAVTEESAADGGSDAVSAKELVERQRARIRTGEVDLRVGNFSDARARVATVTREHGGFVSDASQEVHARDDGNHTWTTGTVTLRVPNGNFTAAYEAVKAVGTVQSASVASRDVTDQLVDLEARIENLQSRRDRLRDLYNDTNDTEAVIEVGERLSAVQGEIERLQAQRKSLREQVALSTITVRLGEPRPEPTTADGADEGGGTPFHEHGLVAAFLDSVDGVVVLGRSVAVFAAYAAPYVLVFGLPAVGYVGWRGWPFGD